MPLRLRAALVSLSILGVSSAHAAGLEVRFYPDKKLYAYELEARRGLSSALLQNATIVNTSAVPITLLRVEIDLLGPGDPAEAIQTHRLSGADLDKAAARGAALESQGMVAALAFQFRPDRLLANAKLSAGRELAPGGAILLGQRPFVFSGQPAALRIHAFGQQADGTAIEGAGAIPIDTAGSKLEYIFPLVGRWFIGAGSTLHSHHRWAVPEEFALDIGRVGDGGTTYKGDGSKRTDYSAYGQEVRAAAAGTVVAAVGSIPETDADFRQPGEALEAYQQRLLENQGKLLAGGIEKAVGNYVVLDHGNGEYSLYAHLQTGSLKVGKGAKVERGQPLARLGTTGNSTEPHLHFQVMDGADPFFSAGIPIRFQGLEIPLSDSPRNVQTGDLVTVGR